MLSYLRLRLSVPWLVIPCLTIPRLTIPCLTILGITAGSTAHAEYPPSLAVVPTPETLFRNQCGICHTLSAKEPVLQGPPLGGVVGRKAGTAPGFKYSDSFANVDFNWDAERLDAWLAAPQAVIPGTVMGYRQANPATRRSIIDWLKEQH